MAIPFRIVQEIPERQSVPGGFDNHVVVNIIPVERQKEIWARPRRGRGGITPVSCTAPPAHIALVDSDRSKAMKAFAYFAAGTLAIGAMVAQAQTSATTGGKTAAVTVIPSVAGPYTGYPYGYYGSSTPGEGYARGIADVIRAQGDYNLSSSAAAVNLSMARQQEIENQKKWTQTYFEIRDINRQVFDTEQKRRRGSPEDWIRYAEAGKPKRLSPSELDAVTGEIHWPMLLTAQDYSSHRIELEKAFAERAYHGVMGAETFLKVLQLTDELAASLKSQIRDLPSEKYRNRQTVPGEPGLRGGPAGGVGYLDPCA